MSLKTEEFDKIGYSTVLILRKNYFFGTVVFNFRQNITVLQILRGGVWPIYYNVLHGGVSKRPQKVLRNIYTAPKSHALYKHELDT